MCLGRYTVLLGVSNRSAGDLLSVNQGTMYPVLLQLEQEGGHCIRMGLFGEQPQGALLSANSHRTQVVGSWEA
jgi:hypothetical protein